MYFSSYLFVHCHLNKPQCEICTYCRLVHTFAELYLAPLTAPGSRRLCKDALGRRRWLSSNRLYAPSSVDGGSHTGLSIVHLDFPFQPKQYLLIITFFTSNWFPFRGGFVCFVWQPWSVSCLSRPTCQLLPLPESWGGRSLKFQVILVLMLVSEIFGSACNVYRVDISK